SAYRIELTPRRCYFILHDGSSVYANASVDLAYCHEPGTSHSGCHGNGGTYEAGQHCRAEHADARIGPLRRLRDAQSPNDHGSKLRLDSMSRYARDPVAGADDRAGLRGAI